jgi:hypothetical protein
LYYIHEFQAIFFLKELKRRIYFIWQVLLEENEKLHREILRLKQDNAGLIKKCKHAMSDKDGIIVSMSVLLLLCETSVLLQVC